MSLRYLSRWPVCSHNHSVASRISTSSPCNQHALTWSVLSRLLHRTLAKLFCSDGPSQSSKGEGMPPESDLLGFDGAVVGTRKNQNQEFRRKDPKMSFEKRLRYKRSLRDVQTLVDGEVLFGLHPVLIALQQNRRQFYRAFVKDSLPKDGELFGRILELTEAKDIEVVPLPVQVLDALSRGAPHQGICLDTSPMHYQTMTDEELRAGLHDDRGHPRLWLYLDEIQDPRNVGAIIRSSYFFGVDKIFAPYENSCRLSAVVHKASSGALELMDLYAMKNTVEFIQYVKENYWSVVGTSGHEVDSNIQVMDIDEYRGNGNTLLLLGNEGKGISPNLLGFCDCLLTVQPLETLNPAIDSLNVSVATGILLHSLTRKFKMDDR